MILCAYARQRSATELEMREWKCAMLACAFSVRALFVSILGRLAWRGFHHHIPRVTVVARLTRQGHLWDSEPENDLLCTFREPVARRPSK